MKELLNRLIEHQTLNQDEAYQLIMQMNKGELNAAQIAAILTCYLMRNISLEELKGFRSALLETSKRIDLSAYDAIDIVGTGGDGKNTFNISTLACFVVAGAGYKVAKHGNFGATSVSGASNVLEYLGIRFSSSEEQLQKSIEKSGIAYLHAPLFNETMKIVASVRKTLGVRTLFNILGPLINPAQPSKMLLGVYNLKLARLYAYVHQQNNQEYTIVNSLDGYDEVSLTSPFKILRASEESIYSPEDIGFKTAHQNDLSGGDSVADAARIFMELLHGKGTEEQKQCVILNAAFAIQTLSPDMDLLHAIDQASESLASRAAKKSFLLFHQLNS
ncbi:MAG: anthranilate phosphoribosyltransferase [Bacteroidales bacterium]